MTSKLTREQLAEWVSQLDCDGGCDATDRQLEALIRQSLDIMNSKPVAHIPVMYKGTELLSKNGLELIRDGIDYATDLEVVCMANALLNAPRPAQVVPDEMTPQQASRSYGGEVRGYRDGWNACRAAMLNGGKS